MNAELFRSEVQRLGQPADTSPPTALVAVIIGIRGAIALLVGAAHAGTSTKWDALTVSTTSTSVDQTEQYTFAMHTSALNASAVSRPATPA